MRVFRVAACLVLLMSAAPLTGCERTIPADAPGDTSPDTRGAVTPYVPPRRDVPVYVDPETGCQYLGYIGHGLTPRIVSINGFHTHKGCKSK